MKPIFLTLICIFSINSCSSQIEIIRVDYKTANQHFARSDTTSYLQKAYSFYENDKIDSAFAYCQKSDEVDPESWEHYFLFGEIFYKLGDHDMAAEHYYRALSACNSEGENRAKIYYAIAETENILGYLKSAKQNFLMVIQIAPNSELAHKAETKMSLLSSAK